LTIILLFLLHPDKHHLKRLGHRLRHVFRLIVVLLVVQVIFRTDGNLLWQAGPVRITDVGLNYGLTTSLRFLLILLVAGLLFDISFHEYLLAFQSWKFPFEISFLVATVIHFIPIYTRQFQRSLETLRLREIEIAELPLRRRGQAYLTIIFPVLARSLAEIKFRAISLEMRGFRLYPQRSSLFRKKLAWFDYAIQLGSAGVFLLIIILRKL
ncbi:MAG: hypothetical protein JW784_06955, partial [Candidatus Cloacimonetes bacterium]|nr:hypothetical protein [Candidatus Cloacimonadota bacterium]